MKKEPVLVSMRDNKKTLFEAGRENYFHIIKMEAENERLKVDLCSALNLLKFVLGNVPQIHFMFEDDGIEDAVEQKPKGDKPGMEVQ